MHESKGLVSCLAAASCHTPKSSTLVWQKQATNTFEKVVIFEKKVKILKKNTKVLKKYPKILKQKKPKLPTCSLFSLSSVRPCLTLVSRGLRALSKSVGSPLAQSRPRATLARDSGQLHSAREYNRHYTVLHKTIYKNSKLFKIRFKILQVLFQNFVKLKVKDFLYFFSICIFSNFKKIFLKIYRKF